jgi:prophage DNA circulation protein
MAVSFVDQFDQDTLTQPAVDLPAPTRGWQDTIDGRPASFRGVPFTAGDLDTTVGRRTVVKSMPGQDKPFVPDQGRRTRRFRVRGVVFGRDYMTQRDFLLAAFEQEGSGTLVHPTLGTFECKVEGDVRLHESVERDQGRADFEAVFVQVTDTLLEVSPDTTGDVVRAAAVARATLAPDFEAHFTIGGMAAAFSRSAVEAMTAASRAFYSVQAKLNVGLGAIDQAESQVLDLSQGIDHIARTPSTYAEEVIGAYGILGGVISKLQEDYRESAAKATEVARFASVTRPVETRKFASATQTLVVDSCDFAAAPLPSAVTALLQETPTRVQQRANVAAIEALTHRAALVAGCQAAALVDYPSSADALGLLTILVDRFAVEENTASTDVYAALVDLRRAIVRHLSTVADELPGAVTYTPARTMPALVVAHQMTGDASTEAELIDANNIRHPLFVPGGQVLRGA